MGRCGHLSSDLSGFGPRCLLVGYARAGDLENCSRCDLHARCAVPRNLLERSGGWKSKDDVVRPNARVGGPNTTALRGDGRSGSTPLSWLVALSSICVRVDATGFRFVAALLVHSRPRSLPRSERPDGRPTEFETTDQRATRIASFKNSLQSAGSVTAFWLSFGAPGPDAPPW